MARTKQKSIDKSINKSNNDKHMCSLKTSIGNSTSASSNNVIVRSSNETSSITHSDNNMNTPEIIQVDESPKLSKK
jgi:hypothetical protein